MDHPTTSFRGTVAGYIAAALGALMLAAIVWSVFDVLRPREQPALEESRPAAARPRIRAEVDLAGVPWNRDAARPEAATVALVSVPWTRRLRSPRPVELAGASVPWSRAAGSPARVGTSPASVPWQRQGRASAVVALARVPEIAARRYWSKPEPATVSPAEIPWQRDLANPSPAQVDAAGMPDLAQLVERM